KRGGGSGGQRTCQEIAACDGGVHGVFLRLMRKVGVNVVVRKVSSSEETISHTFLLEGNPARLMSVEEITPREIRHWCRRLLTLRQSR
ncbi:MAG: hypothetical protein VX311_13255, partial [Planctomycetota bacterium]|nr:hypothetical protein [Planctomycetota bacterium]